MNPRIKCALVMITFLIIFLFYGAVESSGIRTNPPVSVSKEGIFGVMNSRKILEDVQDYDDAGANPRHDVSKGKKGGFAAKTP